MSTNPDVVSASSSRRRQHSSDEESSTPVASCHDSAAGLPVSHKDKRVCIGEHIDHPHTGASTPVLDEQRPIGTPITPEIPKDTSSLFLDNPLSVSSQNVHLPHWESPKANAPFSRHGKHSKNYKADIRQTSPILTKEPSQASRDGLADKSKRLEETASIKKKIRGRILASEQTVNTGEKLLQNIINTGRWDDPLSEWFRRLRIPCHRERVGRVSRASLPSPAAMGIPLAKRPIIPLTPVDKAVGPLDPVSRGDPIHTNDATSRSSESLPSKSAASASSLTQEQMHKYLAWEFPTYKPISIDQPPRFTNLEALYNERFPVSPTMKAIHDITIPVTRKPRDNKKPLELDRRITCHLREEEYRFSLGWKLYLPKSYREISAQPKPWSYVLPDRYARFVYDKAGDVPIRNEQSYSAASLSSGSSDSNGTVVRWPPPSTTVEPVITPESKVETPPDDPLGMEILMYNYNFKDSDPLEHKVKIANALHKEIQIVTGPSMRHQSIVAMYNRIDPIESLPIEHLEESKIKSLDSDYGYGDTTYNWNTDDKLKFEPFIIEKFLAFPGVFEEAPSEGTVEAVVGSLLRGIVAGPGLTDRDQMSAPFPEHLSPVGTTPSPDKYARADNRAEQSLEWPEMLLPVLFGAECKPVKRYSVWHTRAQLATAFHGTLITLILYYLDTRHDEDSALPAWLFLYGIEYTEKGVIIHTHHPAYFIDEKDPDKNHWVLKATIVSTAYAEAFVSGVSPTIRVKLLAALFRIRSHSLHVLKLLKRWKRGPKVLGILTKSPDVIEWSSNVRHVQGTDGGTDLVQ